MLIVFLFWASGISCLPTISLEYSSLLSLLKRAASLEYQDEFLQFPFPPFLNRTLKKLQLDFFPGSSERQIIIAPLEDSKISLCERFLALKFFPKVGTLKLSNLILGNEECEILEKTIPSNLRMLNLMSVEISHWSSARSLGQAFGKLIFFCLEMENCYSLFPFLQGIGSDCLYYLKIINSGSEKLKMDDLFISASLSSLSIFEIKATNDNVIVGEWTLRAISRMSKLRDLSLENCILSYSSFFRIQFPSTMSHLNVKRVKAPRYLERLFVDAVKNAHSQLSVIHI